jgi:hypothetical protein
MFLLSIILLFLSGALAAASLITRRFPQFQDTIIRMGRFKVLLGFVLLLLAIGGTFDLLFGHHLGWFVYVLELLMMYALGLIQGIGILKQLIQNIRFIEKIEDWRSRILPYEEMLGLTAMVLSVFSLLSYIF